MPDLPHGPHRRGLFHLSRQGGLIRPPEMIASHLQRGAADEGLLQNAVTITLSAHQVTNWVQAAVTVTAELRFRRASQTVMDTRGWDTPDIVMENAQTVLSVQPWQSVFLPLVMRET